MESSAPAPPKHNPALPPPEDNASAAQSTFSPASSQVFSLPPQSPLCPLRLTNYSEFRQTLSVQKRAPSSMPGALTLLQFLATQSVFAPTSPQQANRSNRQQSHQTRLR